MTEEITRVLSLKGRPFYQGQGKKYFYNLGDSRGRQAARLKAAASMLAATTSMQTGGAVDPALLERYAGRAQPWFVEKYAHILNDRPRMSGWKAEKPMNLWYPEETAAYLRDGSPRNMEDIVRIMGTVGNERQYPTGGSVGKRPAGVYQSYLWNAQENRPVFPLNGQNG